MGAILRCVLVTLRDPCALRFSLRWMCDFLLCHNAVSFPCCAACDFSVLYFVTSGCDCVNRAVCMVFSVRFSFRSVSFVETLVASNNYVYGFFSLVKSLPSEILRYVLQFLIMLSFFCDSCRAAEDFTFCFCSLPPRVVCGFRRYW